MNENKGTNQIKELERAEWGLPEYERPLDAEDYSRAGSFQRVGAGTTDCPQCERPLDARGLWCGFISKSWRWQDVMSPMRATIGRSGLY
jgi:hypothetical protein